MIDLNTRSAVRDTDIAAKACYRCHKPGHIAVNCPLRNGNAQTFDVKRSAHVHSIEELEQVNTVLCAVNEADINNCSD
ncbi:hypothetical protein P9112_011228 [Eukaryota sp. TZLM1-RC]